jgi:hypothetical protein
LNDGETVVLSRMPRLGEALADVGAPVHWPVNADPRTETLLFITAHILEPASKSS